MHTVKAAPPMLWDSRAGRAPRLRRPALSQNGVVSLIDCTLLEDTESTEEEGGCESYSDRYTRSLTPGLCPQAQSWLRRREDAGCCVAAPLLHRGLQSPPTVPAWLQAAPGYRPHPPIARWGFLT